MTYTLGIDMGVSSIGWAAVSIKDKTIASGVRVFPAGIDKFGSGKDTHLNQERRRARGARRRNRRKAKRKALIRDVLTDLGWMPKGDPELQEWHNLDVYELRSRALRKELSLSELGRIILHLNQRRGFLSLRKSDLAAAEGEEKKELEGMLGEMSHLDGKIKESAPKTDLQTLGNYLYNVYSEHSINRRIRDRHIRREMLHREFDLIWNKQAEFHPELTNTLRYGSHGPQERPTKVVKPIPRDKTKSLFEQFGFENLTFFQRRVYWPMSSIGHCELEPEELRAPIADRRFQEFRMLSELNNLRVLDQSLPGKPAERLLSSEEREAALNYLIATARPTLAGLKRVIGKLPESPEASQLTFNLEQGQRNSIAGLPTEHSLSKAVGKREWSELEYQVKNEIVEILTLPESGTSKVIQRTDDETRDLLAQVPNLTPDQIESLLNISLPAGYSALSIKALNRLLPHMRDGHLFQGKDETNSARHLAGYPRRDEIAQTTLDRLPSLYSLTNSNEPEYEPNFPHVTNSLVLRSLTELRKVVNGVISVHGKPSRIHLEMARDLKMSSKQREDYIRRNNKNMKDRDAARLKLEESGIAPTDGAILLYRLWEDQKRTCIYSGRPISFGQLTSGEVEIDHIYPRRALDDSFMNKVVCFRSENELKGDRLPSEWLASDPEKYEEVTQRAKILPYPKRQRILAESIPEGFAERDLRDTAYMTKVARQYLSLLVAEPHNVICTKGSQTAFLRKHWQVHDLLRDDGLNLKNRDDHRHHALDAIIIALCSHSLLQQIAREIKFENHWKSVKQVDGPPKRFYRLKAKADTLDAPWDGFRESVKDSLEDIWVSHRPKRKLSGPLHEETNYGPSGEVGVLVRRKPISTLTEKELTKIRDPEVARLVASYIGQEKRLFRSDFGKKINEDIEAIFGDSEFITSSNIDQVSDHKLRDMLSNKLNRKNPLQDAELGKITMPSGIPIKKARLLIPNQAAVPLRSHQPKELVIPGNTHHVAIFSLGENKFYFQPVTLLEAYDRKRANLPIVDRTPPDDHPDAEFTMYLCSGDSIIAEIDGKEELLLFSTMPSTSKQIKFVNHIDARDSKSRKAFTAKQSTFGKNFPKARKVEVLPHGVIRHIDLQ